MKDEALVLPNRRIWLVAAAVGAVTSVPVAIGVVYAPWVIAIPILLGVLLVVVFEFAPLKQAQQKQVDARSASEVKHLVRKENPEQTKKPLVDQKRWPHQPRTFIEIEGSLVKTLDSTLASGKRLVLTGKSGSGKTTCAVALCRRYETLNGDSPVTHTPIFLSLSQARRSNGLQTMFLEEISAQLETNFPHDPRSNARKMIKTGSLLIVVDDLDFLGRRGHDELKDLIARWGKNAFMCIISEIPSSSFLSRDFAKLEMRGWESEVVKSYIRRRITDQKKSEKLIESLEAGGELERPLSPWQASFLVDACLEGVFYRLLSLGNAEGELDYKILDDYLRIVMENADPAITYDERIHEIGGLALRLLKEGRSKFDPNIDGINKDRLNGLSSKLFYERDDGLIFVHGNYQIFLAARYIAKFWSEAKLALRDEDAKVLIWKPVYSCARQFIPSTQVRDLEEAFRELGK